MVLIHRCNLDELPSRHAITLRIGSFVRRSACTTIECALTHDLSAPHDRLNGFLIVLHPFRYLDESGEDCGAHSIHVTTFTPETSPDEFDLLWE